jgi:hypothetical protein
VGYGPGRGSCDKSWKAGQRDGGKVVILSVAKDLITKTAAEPAMIPASGGR